MASIPAHFTKYYVIIPLTMTCALVAVLIAGVILTLIVLKKRLHTVTHMLIGNTCVSSIFFCVVQCNNNIYLGFVYWQMSDASCRWRAYFAYMSIAAVVYSYLLQAVSRFLFSVLPRNHRWLISVESHALLIVIQWILVVVMCLPARLSEVVNHRPFTYCWVPKKEILHNVYLYVVCYLLPIALIISMYISIYRRVKRSKALTVVTLTILRQNRDAEVLRNIMILFGIYIVGGAPTVIYLITAVDVFYSIGIVFVSLAVAVEKAVTIVIDRELRQIVKQCYTRRKTRVVPF